MKWDTMSYGKEIQRMSGQNDVWETRRTEIQEGIVKRIDSSATEFTGFEIEAIETVLYCAACDGAVM